jgi:hypothetical protein
LPPQSTCAVCQHDPKLLLKIPPECNASHCAAASIGEFKIDEAAASKLLLQFFLIFF